jgi:lipopolysaccharide/colanic/teichoic acid biosynthesis glycosyltransferase/predicted ABC-type ATPase
LKEPFLLIVAGPNGAGKTTLTRWLRSQEIDFGEYINADDIASELQGPEDVRVREAQRIADVRREQCLEARRSFTFETVMSHPSKVELLKRAKQAGFFVQLFFVGTDDSEINVARVALRVKQGGHDVPEDKIVSRWQRTMDLLAEAVRSVDEAFVFDNSSAELGGGPRLVFHRKAAEQAGKSQFQFFRTTPDWVWQYIAIPLDLDPQARRTRRSYAVEQDRRGNVFAPALITGKRSKAAHDHIASCVASLDAVLIVGASVCAHFSYAYFPAGMSPPDFLIALGVGMIAAAIYWIIGRSFGCYDLPFLLADRPRPARIALAWTGDFLFLMLVLFLMKVGLARGPMVVFAFMGLTLLLLFRLSTVSLLRSAKGRRFLMGHGAVLVGEREELATIDSADLLHRFGIRELARVSFDPALPAVTRNAIANADRAIEIARKVGASEIVVAVHWSDPALLELLRNRMRPVPLRVRLLPDRNARSILRDTQFLVELQREPLDATERFTKRVFDLVVASAMIVCLLPLLLVSAVAIKIDSPGPVLFRQRRRAFNGKLFLVRQFRTMRVEEGGPQVTQASAPDARITAIGRLIRRKRIHVLPQLFSVLNGDMSLVGPRANAHAIGSEHRKRMSDFAFRHHIKPGVTGLAQIGGFGTPPGRTEDIEGRFEVDFWYINNWSLWLDIRIALVALWKVMRD